MAPARVAALVLSMVAAGCAFRRGDPLPDDPPRDFALTIVVRDAVACPWDGRVEFRPTGEVDYDITFKDPVSDRRGRESLPEEVRNRVWAAVVGAGFFDRVPVPAGAAAGPVVVEGRALGMDGRWSGDPAADESLAGLLEALRAASPPRVFRPLPRAEPPR